MLTLIPAYGRDYKSKAAILADLEAGKDFKSVGYHGEGYINLQGLQETGERNVTVRYGQLRKVAIIKVPERKPCNVCRFSPCHSECAGPERD